MSSHWYATNDRVIMNCPSYYSQSQGTAGTLVSSNGESLIVAWDCGHANLYVGGDLLPAPVFTPGQLVELRGPDGISRCFLLNTGACSWCRLQEEASEGFKVLSTERLPTPCVETHPMTARHDGRFIMTCGYMEVLHLSGRGGPFTCLPEYCKTRIPRTTQALLFDMPEGTRQEKKRRQKS